MKRNELFVRIQKLFGINEHFSTSIFYLNGLITSERKRKIKNKFRQVERKLCSLTNTLILEHFHIFCLGVLAVMIILLICFLILGPLTAHQAALLAIALVTAFVAMFTLVCNHRVNTIRHYAQNEARIRELEKECPTLYNMAQADEYRRAKEQKEFFEYDSLANQSLTLCLEIFNEPFWSRTLKEHFINFFERVRKIHSLWFEENISLFPDDFVRYMKAAEWRELVEPAHADQLRWLYEVDLYDRRILSPLHPDLEEKLHSMIDKSIKEFYSKKKPPYNVADMGCGNGKLAEWLAGRNDTKKVQGIDYSVSMIQAAIKRANWNDKMQVANADLRDLSGYRNKFDIVFSINSILPRDPDDMPKMLEQISSTIVTGGLFIAILPSFDTVLELKRLEENKLIKKYEEEGKTNAAKLAKKKVNKKCKERKLNEKRGIYADDKVNPQRFFKKSEIWSLLKNVNLLEIKREEFSYPWVICRRYHWGYHPDTQESIYDWFLVARKE